MNTSRQGKCGQGRIRIKAWRAISLSAVAGLWLLGAPCAASAEEMAWRQSSIRTETQGSSYVRRGVAMFADGEPATLTFRAIAKPPESGRQVFSGRMVMRFEDGASFTFDMDGVSQWSAPGAPPTVSAAGKMVEGTGRFAGIRGTVEFNGRGMDIKADGALGDIFAKASANYTLQK